MSGHMFADEPQKPDFGIWGGNIPSTIWEKWEPDLSTLQTEMQALVNRYYDGCVVKYENSTLTFEHRTRKFWIHHPYLDGGWQDAREKTGPNSKGIYCTITTRSGNTLTQAVVPQKVDCYYFVDYWMAPYSSKLDGSLIISLRYPTDVDSTFISEFETIVHQFDKFLRDRTKPD
jgi:hypothetical protein